MNIYGSVTSLSRYFDFAAYLKKNEIVMNTPKNKPVLRLGLSKTSSVIKKRSRIVSLQKFSIGRNGIRVLFIVVDFNNSTQ